MSKHAHPALPSARPGLHLSEIWRYPVKSMRGEQLPGALVTEDGVTGDRMVHVAGTRGPLTGRTRYGLLTLSGTVDNDGVPRVQGLPWDSEQAAAKVRAVAGPDARLVHDGSRERFDVLPLLISTEAETQRLGIDRRRLRPNLVVSGALPGAERGWPGRALEVGDALIGIYALRARCIVTTIDPDSGEQDLEVLRRIRRDFAGSVSLDSWVIRPGVVRVGDQVRVVSLPEDLADVAGANPGGWITGQPYNPSPERSGAA
jgi:uncharacterized protein YcbX